MDVIGSENSPRDSVVVMSAPFSGLAVILHGVAVVEGAPFHVLPTQAHRVGSQVQPGRRIRIFTCMPTPMVLRDT